MVLFKKKTKQKAYNKWYNNTNKKIWNANIYPPPFKKK